MSRAIELTDEQYAILEQAMTARPSGTIAALVQEWVDALACQMRPPEHYYAEAEFDQVLGVSDEIKAESVRLWREQYGSGDADL